MMQPLVPGTQQQTDVLDSVTGHPARQLPPFNAAVPAGTTQGHATPFFEKSMHLVAAGSWRGGLSSDNTCCKCCHLRRSAYCSTTCLCSVVVATVSFAIIVNQNKDENAQNRNLQYHRHGSPQKDVAFPVRLFVSIVFVFRVCEVSRATAGISKSNEVQIHCRSIRV